MSYNSNDYSYCYSSGDDSFSYVSDSTTSSSYYCPLHYQQQQQVYTPPAQPQIQYQVSPSFQTRIPTKKETRRFTEEQIRILEEHFYKVDKYVSKVTIDELSSRTQLKPAQIRVWFNNKRSREHQ